MACWFVGKHLKIIEIHLSLLLQIVWKSKSMYAWEFIMIQFIKEMSKVLYFYLLIIFWHSV